ncbi:MAG: hypothetical protein L0H63_05650 [Nitrococcus sp.]|nr:hypothetical protein [Nitrococcus sp.]
MKNGIIDLRNHLFVTLEALHDSERPMEIERAKAIAEVAQTIINSAKVEVDFLRASGADIDTGFIGVREPGQRAPGLGLWQPTRALGGNGHGGE